jgi:hypothetical protein
MVTQNFKNYFFDGLLFNNFLCGFLCGRITEVPQE